MDSDMTIPHNSKVKFQNKLDSHKHEMSRYIVSFMRQQAGTATSQDIALAFMADRGQSRNNPKEVADMKKRVGYALTRLGRKGLIRQASKDSGGFWNWGGLCVNGSNSSLTSKCLPQAQQRLL